MDMELQQIGIDLLNLELERKENEEIEDFMFLEHELIKLELEFCLIN